MQTRLWLMCLLLPLGSWAQFGYSAGPTLLVPQGELGFHFENAVGFQFGLGYKFEKIRTTVNANFALNRYAKETERIYNYPAPDYMLDEVDISVIGAIRYSYLGLSFEPFKPDPRINPFISVGTGHSGFRSYWELDENSGSKSGYYEVHRLSLSRTLNFTYGAGVKVALLRYDSGERLDLVLQILRHQGGQVQFLNPERNPAHYNFNRHLIDRNSGFSARSDFVSFWLGLQIRFPSKAESRK
jgi:hypothetical protein